MPREHLRSLTVTQRQSKQPLTCVYRGPGAGLVEIMWRSRLVPARVCCLRTTARYSNLCAPWPPWAGIDIRTGLHHLIATRTVPVVCIQKASVPWTRRGPSEVCSGSSQLRTPPTYGLRSRESGDSGRRGPGRRPGPVGARRTSRLTLISLPVGNPLIRRDCCDVFREDGAVAARP